MIYQNIFKRIIDLIVSLVVFILFLPVFFIVSICLYIVNQGKPFFFQSRPGKQGKEFKVIKFKTMNDRKGGNGELLSDQERLTSVGKLP